MFEELSIPLLHDAPNPLHASDDAELVDVALADVALRLRDELEDLEILGDAETGLL